MRKTNPDSLRNLPLFASFRLNFASDFFDLLLVRFHARSSDNCREASYPTTQE